MIKFVLSFVGSLLIFFAFAGYNQPGDSPAGSFYGPQGGATTQGAQQGASGNPQQASQQQSSQVLMIFQNVSYENFSGSKNDFFSGDDSDDGDDGQKTFKIGDDTDHE